MTCHYQSGIMRLSTYFVVLFMGFLTLSISATTKKELLQDVAKLCKRFCVARPDKDRLTAKKGIPVPDIYVPMDRIDGTKTAATGIEVTVQGFPKPSISPGKFGGSIFLGNTQTYDNKYIDLGYLKSRCVDNLDKCKDGLTVSLWFWHEYIYDWPAIISASQWQIHTNAEPRDANEVYMFFFNSDGTKRYVVGGRGHTSVPNQQWHNVAFVFRDYGDVRLFVDGELNSETIRLESNMAQTNKHVQVGCHMGGNCMRGKFDDMKIWEKALTDEEIKEIYNQKSKVIVF